MLELCLWSDWGAQVEQGWELSHHSRKEEECRHFIVCLLLAERAVSCTTCLDVSRLFILHFSQIAILQFGCSCLVIF